MAFLLSPWVALATSLTLAMLACRLAFVWLESARASGLPARVRRVLWAGLSVGTGIWSVHGIDAAAGLGGLAAQHHQAGEIALWLLASVVSMAALARSGGRKVPARHWLVSACALGAAIPALQVTGMLTSAWEPGIEWRAGPLLLAWIVCPIGCLLAFGLFHTTRDRHRRATAWCLAASGGLLGAALVASQHLVTLAADLPAQSASPLLDELSGGTLGLLATAGAAALLLALHGVHALRRRPGRRSGGGARSALGFQPTSTL